jgi:16S rRNA (cytosine1402-N4)-methyltransferase
MPRWYGLAASYRGALDPDARPQPQPEGQHASDAGHVPVLLDQWLAMAAITPGSTVVDLTVGRGGHAVAMAGALEGRGVVVLNDADPGNLAFAAGRVREAVGSSNDLRIVELQGNFVDVPRRLSELDLAADVVLADLGFASNQMDIPERGLSFRFEGPLDMRFDPTSSRPTAAELLNTLSEPEIAEMLRDLGEERAWRRVAAEIARRRDDEPLATTTDLVEAVVAAIGPRGGGPRIHPATRTFQALRIAVNDELGCLASLLESIRRGAERVRRDAPAWVRPSARIGVVAFHSLEDRMVKRAIADLKERGLAAALTRRPAEATDEEIACNPRARSAKLRVLQVNEPSTPTRGVVD